MTTLALSFLFVSPAAPALQLPSLIGDNMTLQRNAKAPIWGWSTPGASVTIKPSWTAKTYSATADATGKWIVRIQTGGGSMQPHTIDIASGGDSKRLTNVAIGEVWLCSGQSNMWWPLGPHQGLTPVEGADDAVKSSANANLRLFTVGYAYVGEPQRDCKGAWLVSSPTTTHDFSATAYFFGRELQKRLNVPVGLIVSAVGGTESELWTSREKLLTIPEFRERIVITDASRAAYEAEMRKYEIAIQSFDPGMKQFTSESCDDSSWPTSQEPQIWSRTPLKSFDGVVYFRKSVRLTADQAASLTRIELGAIDDNEQTFVNGVKVGETEDYATARSYAVRSGLLHSGSNSIVVRVEDTGGEGGFSGPADVMRLTSKSGATVSLAGDWRYKLGPSMSEIPSRPSTSAPPHSTLYNGMIAPLLPYGIKGAIWYQGEANVNRAYQYRTAFPAMIQDWRARFKQGDFPFYFVQIAPHPYNWDNASCELREAQVWTRRHVKRTGIVVPSDITPNVNDIHPSFKLPVGQRLARLAFSRLYGAPILEDESPLFRSMKVEGERVRLSFDNAQRGLKSKDAKLEGFLIAGPDRKFVRADARIEGSEIVVWSTQVQRPEAVRYGWTDISTATVWNVSGLPLSCFRTDQWPGITQNVRW